MKLSSRTQSLPRYDLMWKCGGCGRWNKASAEDCLHCAGERPLPPTDAKPRRQLVTMLDTLVLYCEDNGLTMMSTIFRAILIALFTETEGHLSAVCRGWTGVHVYYRQSGDDILDKNFEWRKR